MNEFQVCVQCRNGLYKVIQEVQQKGMQEVSVQRQEIDKLLEKLEARKAMGPDGVSSWTLKECRKQLVEPIWNVINSSLKEGNVPRVENS